MAEYDFSNLPEGDDTPINIPAPDLAKYETPVVVENRSDLDQIADDLAELVAEPVLITVPLRPGYQLQVTPEVSHADVEGWRKQSKSKRFTDGFDPGKVNRLGLAHKTTALLKHGKTLVDEYGDPLNFRHRQLQTRLGVESAEQAVGKFFGSDGHIMAAAQTVLNEAGWGEELSADPTSAG